MKTNPIRLTIETQLTIAFAALLVMTWVMFLPIQVDVTPDPECTTTNDFQLAQGVADAKWATSHVYMVTVTQVIDGEWEVCSHYD